MDTRLTERYSYNSQNAIITYGYEPKRFLMLGLMMATFIINQLGYFFDNIPTPDFLQYFALLLFIPLFYSSVRMIEDWGLYPTLMLVLVLQTFGLLLGNSLQRVLTYPSAVLISSTVGELLNASALVYLFNGITKFSGLWFGPKGRIFSTAFLLSSIQIGQNIANWIIAPSVIVDFDDFLMKFWYVVCGINVILFIVAAVLFKNEPEDCPSTSQSYYRKKPFNFKDSMQALLQDKIFTKSLAICVVFLAYIYCSPYNFYWYRFHGATNLAFDFIQPPCYIIGIIFFAILLSRKFEFKKVFFFAVLMNVAFTLVTEMSYLLESVAMLFLGFLFQGVFIGGLKLLVYEYITEIAYPVGPGFAIAVLHAFSNIAIFILTVVSDTLGSAGNEKPFLHTLQFAFIGLLPLCALYLMKLGFKLKRLDIDFPTNTTSNQF